MSDDALMTASGGGSVGAPPAQWLLGSARALLAVGLIGTILGVGAGGFLLAAAGGVSLALGARWLASASIWRREYAWMRALPSGQSLLLIGWVITSEGALNERVARGIGVAMTVISGLVLVLIGIGSQAGWM